MAKGDMNNLLHINESMKAFTDNTEALMLENEIMSAQKLRKETAVH